MTYAYFPAYSEGTTEKQQKIQRQENNEATSRATQKKTKEEDRRPSERSTMKNDTFNQIINANLASIDPGFGQFALAKASSDLMKKVLNK